MESSATSDATVRGEPRAINKWAIAVTVSIAALLEIIDTSIVNVALTDIQASFGTTLTEVAWVVSAYAVANVIVLPLSAWLGERFGKKRYFVFSLVGFVAASVLCGMATTFPLLVAARVLQGLTGGGLLAKAQTVLFETFPPSEQAMAQGLFGIIAISGPAIGPTLGGYLTTALDWRWIFFVNVPVGLVAVPMSLAFLPKDAKRTTKAPVDWLAIGLLAVGLGAFQAVLEEGEQDLWFESDVIRALSAIAVVGLLAFVFRSLRSAAPVVDLRVLRYRSLWAGSLLSAILGMVHYGSLFAIPVFADLVLHETPLQVGFILLPSALASALAMPVTARLLRSRDPKAILAAGACIMLASLAMFSHHLSPQTGEDDLFWPNIVRGFGIVLMFLPLQVAALGSVPRERVAAAAGVFNLTRQLGGSVGVALLTTLLDQRVAFHRAALAEKLLPGDPRTIERLGALTRALIARGAPLAQAPRQALALLDGTLNLQATVMSFADTFVATAALMVVAAPLIALLRRPVQGVGVPAGH